jgi:hypothetical protein
MNTNLKIGAIIVSEFMDIQYVLLKNEWISSNYWMTYNPITSMDEFLVII